MRLGASSSTSRTVSDRELWWVTGSLDASISCRNRVVRSAVRRWVSASWRALSASMYIDVLTAVAATSAIAVTVAAATLPRCRRRNLRER